MTPDEARARLKAQRSRSRRQRVGDAARHERASARWRAALELVHLTRAEAAERLGLTDMGLRTMITRETGSQTWPPVVPS